MDRKEFLRNSLIIGGAALLPANSVLAQNVSENGMDKLVDANGKFIQQPLPYANNFLEPYMDAETMHHQAASLVQTVRSPRSSAGRSGSHNEGVTPCATSTSSSGLRGATGPPPATP